MTTIRVFDPAMCCSTGVCGPSVDPELVRFAADLDWLKAQGVSVERFNLSQQPGAFVDDAAARMALDAKGETGLPLVKVNGEVKSSGVYPSRGELAAWAGIGGSTSSLYTEAVAELVAIGASIAAGCEPCLKFHFDKARKLGVSADDIARAVATAEAVKAAQARAVLEAAERHLHREPAPVATAPKAKSGGCFGSAKSAETAAATNEKVVPKAGGCCGPEEAASPTAEDVSAESGGCCGGPATSGARSKSGSCC
jgi:AhpD family alkylhydroperoxidase